MRFQAGPFAASGWSIDTRTLQPGDLFIALRGPSFDGNAFVAEALGKGACGVLAERLPDDASLHRSIHVVADTQVALEALGREARRHWGGTVVAVTGSAGKTSTKDILATFLGTVMPTAKTAGNLNNQIGVPLSILRIPDDAKAAVLEMGMNHAGEIAHLSSIARPDAGVVTNVGWAHIENFASQDGIARAKRELVESLPATGVAILNEDDPHVRTFRHHTQARVVTFGLSDAAMVRAESLALEEMGSSFLVDGVRYQIQLPGRHGVLNTLAAIAAVRGLGLNEAGLPEAAHALQPGKMRGERLAHAGATLINDCYNSNPDAARAMIAVLRDIPARRRIAVLGEMLELGQWAEPLHRDVGAYVAEQGIPLLVGTRGAARWAVEAYRSAGLPGGTAYFYDQPEEAGEFIRSILAPGDAVLFKGSRGARVEQALNRVLGPRSGQEV
jgi:UDP-N-acetylmuramoyl-tripeptide--D-alanyl-D-alanine ligase